MAAEVWVRRNQDRGTAMKNAWMHAALGAALIAGISGCRSKSVNAQSGPDPAAANLAQPGTENEAQQQAEQYSNGQQPAAPIERAYPGGQQSAPPPGYSDYGQQYPGDAYGEGDDQYAPIYDDSLTDEQASEPPPPIPDYDQPPAPDPDYIWTPGYWAWGPYGYYWVPGCWVEAPYVGALWTPGYWAYVGGVYRFHHGYWARHIGFYGGINYGFGYFGVGYEGGYWNGPHFYYNTVVTHVNRDRVRDVYAHNVTENRGGARISFNGGRGGLQVRPRPAEISAMHEQRYAPMQSQLQVRQQASQNRQQFYSSNHGRPAEAVASRPIVSEHRMPAEMPRMATRPEGRGAAGAVQPGNRQQESGRPQTQQQQGRPDFRNQQQQGRPDFQRPQQQPQAQPQQPQQRQDFRGQQGRPDFQRPQQQPQAQPQAQPQQQRQDFRGQQGRPDFQRPQQQPQPQPQAQPQRQDFRGQQGRPDVQRPQQQPQAQPQQPQQQRQDFRGQGRPDFQRPQQQPQAQPQPRPQPQIRQAPPPQAQHAGPEARPQVRHQGPPQRAAQPQPQHQGPPPQAHDNGHGDGHDQEKH
ncbi:MAG TPA: hypothetical protein VN612_16380 [Acidobacteriaceae bacterium]|nr:hypothetical protein [Acidobacteriaceae bacterium]